MPGLLDALGSEQGILGDPFEAAAARLRAGYPQEVRPPALIPFILGGLANNAIQGMATLPQRLTKSAGDLQRTGDVYDPAPALELMMNMAGARSPFMKTGEAGVMGGKLIQPEGIRAYHGSPHDFDRFDMSKIGTGEGAQAYGHGLYFAGNEAVARSYRDALSGRVAASETDPAMIAASVIQRSGRDGAIRYFERQMERGRDVEVSQKAKELIEQGASLPEINPGRMYEVNINARPEQFLDWDKPLSAQPHIASAIEKNQLMGALPWDQSRAMVPTPGTTGSDIYRALQNSLLRKELERGGFDINNSATWPKPSAVDVPASRVSGTLAEAGIPGIKYLDQGSRFQPQQVEHLNKQIAGLENLLKERPSDQGVMRALEGRKQELAAIQPTSNYVVFDDSLIDILRKYGLAGMAPAGLAGMMGLGVQEQKQ